MSEARHISAVLAPLFCRGDLPRCLRDTHTGRTLRWSDELQGYEVGAYEMVPAFFVRSNYGYPGARFLSFRESTQLMLEVAV